MIAARVFTVSTAVSLAAMIAFSGGAYAADISLENFTVSKPGSKAIATMKLIKVTGTNISKDELTKLLTPSTSKEERVAITTKMKADLISIPSVEITNKEKPGKVTLSGFSMTGVDAGKFSKAMFEGIEGRGETDQNGGFFTIKSGPMVIESGDMSGALTAVKNGDITNGVWRVGKFSWSNFEVTVPEKKRGQVHMHTFKLGSMTGETKYSGAVPTESAGEFKDMVFQPDPKSRVGQSMAAFGYPQVKLGMTFAGTYDVKAKKFNLTDYTVKGDDTAVLTVSGVFGNIDAAAFNGDKRQRQMALMGGDFDDLKIRVVNNGLLDKALVFFAKMKGGNPEAIKQQWAGMAGQMLPMFLGGDSSALQSAAAVSEFIKTPKNLVVTANGKAGPIPFKSFAGIKNPMQLFSKMKVEAVANR